MLYRLQARSLFSRHAAHSPRTSIVFIEAESEARAKARAVEALSLCWQTRHQDVELLGRVRSADELLAAYAPVNDWLDNRDCGLFAVYEDDAGMHDGHEFFSGEQCFHFVGPAWNARLATALFWIGFVWLDDEVDRLTSGVAGS